MALTPQQEAVLAKIADAALAEEAYRLKVEELDAARAIAQDLVYAKHESAIKGSTGAQQKAAILALQAEIAADSEVSKLEAEAAALRNARTA